MTSVRALLSGARDRLRDSDLELSLREAALLLSHVLELSEAELIARDRQPVPADVARRFGALLDRRLAGEPFAYIVGEREFFGRPFAVDRRVLVPRPETEHLVELALELAPEASARPRILDLGTGSGCVAVTLACELPTARVVAVDRSLGALAVTMANALRHDVDDRVTPVASVWSTGLDAAACDLLVANPPYVGDSERGSLSREILDYEPSTALFGGDDDGTAALESMLGSLRSTRRGTPLLVEIGAGRLQSVSRAAREEGWTLRDVVDDYAGLARIVHLSKD